MSIKSWGDGTLTVPHVPTDSHRIDIDRRAKIARETDPSQEWVDCPGGCGGLAKLEAPLSVTRDGKTRHLRMAECCGECKVEQQSPVSKKAKTVPARFEIPWDIPEQDPDLASLLSQAMSQAHVTQNEAATEIGCSQSSVSKMLRGVSVTNGTAQSALAWARKVLNGTSAGEPTIEDSVVPLKISTHGGKKRLTPYEAILRTMLEEVAQQRLQEIAGPAAKGVVAHVTLEWNDQS